jgi:hypothetical protein
MLALVRHPFALSHDIGAAAELLRILPPRNMAVAVRLSQYILRLSHSWRRASAAGYIVLFDQGFIQLICSLALFARSADEWPIADALNASPRSDLLIRLDAPRELLVARLNDRQRQQSAVERMFEFDLNTNLKSIRIINQLHRVLLDRGESVSCASSLDQQSLSQSVERVEEILMARLGAAWDITARPRPGTVNLRQDCNNGTNGYRHG